MLIKEKGDNVSRKDPVRHEFYETYTSQQDLDDVRRLNVDIYECGNDAPPSRKTASVHLLCDITIMLGDVKYDMLENYSGQNGRLLKRWRYDVVMVPSGASTEFAVYHEDRKVGSHNVAVEFQ
jgi:hypothetical protein